MNKEQILFLSALKASLMHGSVSWDEEISFQEWISLFKMAEIHKVLPMIYEAVYKCPSAQRADTSLFASFKQRTMQSVMVQTMKTVEFLNLYQHLCRMGVRPLVVKGIICRNIYPNPDYRSSSDEDLLISKEQFRACHRAMLSYGMEMSVPVTDLDAVHEVSYVKKGSPLYIELHKSLFSPEAEAYGFLNQFFDDVQERVVVEYIQGVPVASMSYTDHLFYLICHAFKHFLHSGFGIRQICDIVLFANNFGEQIDWQKVLHRCEEIHAEKFTAALFQIGERYLIFSPQKAHYPVEWQKICVDEQPLLEDLLQSGIYGSADMSRKHSSMITLNAVAAQKKHGKSRFKRSILKTVFPSAKSLEGRFPYLKRCSLLLPVAWVSRLVRYEQETRNSAGNNAAKSIRIGNERVELLKQYGIIEWKQ